MAFDFIQKLPTPQETRELYPVPPRVAKIKEERDKEIRKVFTGESDKFLAIIGPCSADNEEAVCDYVSRLVPVQEKIKDKVLIIPRIYTNKPRTTGEGYKGMLHQPDPEKKPDLVAGIKAIRKLHIDVISNTGFFPADDPEYTAIAVVYSKLSTMDYYGGSMPATVIREIVNSIYCLTPGWNEELGPVGKVPEMQATRIETGEDNLDQVPDITGLGLKDAIYSLENCGYKYEYEGYGHVASQKPGAGARAAKGTTVRFVLK